MKIETQTEHENKIQVSVIEIALGIILFIFLFAWGVVQPIGSQPDELTRYMIPYYIFSTGKLPDGNLPELLVRGYGISYGFFPCLPYIFMAIAMKIASIFADSSYSILMAARTVNMIAGVVSFIFVRKIAKKLMTNEFTGWLFTLIICFWPQVLFIFTYTNCDGFAFMSCAIICYALVCGMKDGWNIVNVLVLSVGVSICLLSYFNAYGMILGAGVLFVLSFIDKNEKYTFDYKAFVKYGGIAIGVIFVLSGWWFIRNAVLYNGDFIGMEANRICAEINAVDYLKPSMKDTLKNNGKPFSALLFDSSYMFLLKQSFFGRFGNMELQAPNYIVRFYKLFLLATFVGLFIPCRERVFKGIKRFAFGVGMFVAALTPVLLTLIYSYADDYQPQGRYMLPGLIPLMCILFIGVRNIRLFPLRFGNNISEKSASIYKIVCICLYVYIGICAIGCIVMIMNEYTPVLPDTFGLIYTGNLYE